MKQSRVIGIVLAVANAILVVACAVLYLGTDRTEPKMEFKASDVVYRSGMDKDKLLTGIVAYDSNDGDITDKIVIEKIIENEEDDSVIVFYAVNDRAGNVAKCSRVFQAVFAKGTSDSEDEEVKLLMEAGIEADLEREEEKEAASEETAEAELFESPTPTPTATPTATPSPTPEPTPEQPAQPPAPTVNPSAPILTFRTSQVQINAGDSPAWVDIIETMRDDQDNYETLYYNLNISKFDRNKPGTYPVTVYTEDSEGNKSQTLPITIIVK